MYNVCYVSGFCVKGNANFLESAHLQFIQEFDVKVLKPTIHNLCVSLP